MISIDRVYQKVLAIANKEQRGYITPQEFNLFADQAQMEIFQQYFYDLDQFERRLGSDGVELVNDKIQIFKIPPFAIAHGNALPSDTYKVDSVWIDWDNDERSVVERIDGHGQGIDIKACPLLRTSLVPMYHIYNNNVYFMTSYDTGTTVQNGHFRINLTRKPVTPNWTYYIDSATQSALYNSSAADLQDFELHISEENNLVVKILLLAGISMKDMGLAQLAGQKEANIKQQEKQ
tara:strand:- start:1106 stop:1810 length:705 start_codon:yes stop_codon:yes gene_type:complete